MALIPLLAAALALTAEPPRLVLGKDVSSILSVAAPEGAKAVFTTSVGRVAEQWRDGAFIRAKYEPPALPAPTVALVLAQVDDGEERSLSWLALPLSGSDTAELETRPGAQVEADIAGVHLGPVTADKKGVARLPLVVPPGQATATLKITDRLGNSSLKKLDLDPPPFSRLRLAARSASATVASPLEIEVFVVKPDGTPDRTARVELHADDGETESRGQPEPGVYLMRYHAPQGKTGTVRLEAKANGQLAALEVPVALPRVILAQPFWQSALTSERPWSLSAGLRAGGGVTFDGSAALTVLVELALRLEVLPLEGLFQFGAGFFTEATQPGTPATTTERARAQARLAQLGVRANKQLLARLDGHAALLFGLQQQLVSTTLQSGTVLDLDAITPRVALQLGVNFRVGPGRALAELQFDSAASGIARLHGSTGGAQLLAGYAFTLY